MSEAKATELKSYFEKVTFWGITPKIAEGSNVTLCISEKVLNIETQ